MQPGTKQSQERFRSRLWTSIIHTWASYIIFTSRHTPAFDLNLCIDEKGSFVNFKNLYDISRRKHLPELRTSKCLNIHLYCEMHMNRIGSIARETQRELPVLIKGNGKTSCKTKQITAHVHPSSSIKSNFSKLIIRTCTYVNYLESP